MRKLCHSRLSSITSFLVCYTSLSTDRRKLPSLLRKTRCEIQHIISERAFQATSQRGQYLTHSTFRGRRPGWSWVAQRPSLITLQSHADTWTSPHRTLDGATVAPGWLDENIERTIGHKNKNRRKNNSFWCNFYSMIVNSKCVQCAFLYFLGR